MNPTERIPQIDEALEWRYATKSFDAERQIDPATWDFLERSLVLTPSSYGLQPWKFFIVGDPAIRAKFRENGWGQSQFTDASHVIVFAIVTDLPQSHVDKYAERIAEVRGVPVESLSPLMKMIESDVIKGPRRAIVNEWAARQAYIALGQFMGLAAVLGIDTCPIEGFDPAAFDEILGLKARGLASVVCCAAGYRSPSDKYADYAKVRFAPEDVIEHI